MKTRKLLIIPLLTFCASALAIDSDLFNKMQKLNRGQQATENLHAQAMSAVGSCELSEANKLLERMRKQSYSSANIEQVAAKIEAAESERMDMFAVDSRGRRLAGDKQFASAREQLGELRRNACGRSLYTELSDHIDELEEAERLRQEQLRQERLRQERLAAARRQERFAQYAEYAADLKNSCLGTAQRETGNCYWINDPDLKNNCLGIVQRETGNCYWINDPDLKNNCLGIVQRETGNCYWINDPDLKNSCLGIVQRETGNCYWINDPALKANCFGQFNPSNCHLIGN